MQIEMARDHVEWLSSVSRSSTVHVTACLQDLISPLSVTHRLILDSLLHDARTPRMCGSLPSCTCKLSMEQGT
jgi:hypothetical protein